MGERLIESCQRFTGREYPQGYGFALGYLFDNAGPEHFKAMQAAAWGAVKREARKGNRDAGAFVAAYCEKRDWRSWLIEAAQLVHADAHAGGRVASRVMAMWQHPGYC